MYSKKRVRELEKRTPIGELRTGVWYDGEPTLEVIQTQERLTPAEFERKYPDGLCIKVVFDGDPD